MFDVYISGDSSSSSLPLKLSDASNGEALASFELLPSGMTGSCS